MTRDYDSHVTQQAREGGSPVVVADVGRWDWHRRRCPVCRVSTYSYTRCPEGSRLAKAVDSSPKLPRSHRHACGCTDHCYLPQFAQTTDCRRCSAARFTEQTRLDGAAKP